MAFRRGYRAELELVDILLKEGFCTVRVPVSGGRGFPCDVLAAKGGDRRAYEIKSTKEKVYYFYEDDIEPLLEFAKKSDRYEGEGVTEADIQELTTLWKRKYKYLANTPTRIREVFEMEARTRIVIAGTRRG